MEKSTHSDACYGQLAKEMSEYLRKKAWSN